MAEHGIELVQLMHALGDFIDRDAQFVRQGVLCRVIVRQELVQRRVKQTNRRRQTVQRLEDADEVHALIRQQFRQGFLAVLDFLGQDHLPHGINPVAFEEHVFRSAKADAGGAERDGIGGLRRGIRIRADLHACHLRTPLHELREVPVGPALLWTEGLLEQHLNDFRWRRLHLAGVNRAARAIDRKIVALVERLAAHRQCPGVIIDLQCAGAADADFAHLTGHQRRVRTDAAARREDAFRRDHAAQVLRRSLDPGEQNLLALVRGFDRAVRIEINFA